MNINDQQGQDEKTLTLEGLPHPILTEISSYLKMVEPNNKELGSGILLAVALTASKSSWDKLQYDDTTDINRLLSPTSEAVLRTGTEDYLGNQCDTFDLYNMQLNFGATMYYYNYDKLDDIDLKAILICIDARNNVKSLKLTGGLNISGRGLEPLAGSKVIERIDLSLERGCIKDSEQISLSEGVVLPLLQSIIEGNSSSLRHIQLPVKWRKDKSTDLTRFMEVYNSHLRDSARLCQHEWKEGGVQKKCENRVGMGMHTQTLGVRYGIQTGTCYQCMKNFCGSFRCADTLDYCPQCQKYLCNECNNVYECSNCFKTSCDSFECGEVRKCDVCSEAYCPECISVGVCNGGCYQAVCDDCGTQCHCCQESLCYDCGDMTTCDNCDEEVCSDCIKLLRDCRICEDCNDMGWEGIGSAG